MEEYYKDQYNKLSIIANRKRVTRAIRGTTKLTETSRNTNLVTLEANLLLDQANTAGGWQILRHDIANFLYRAK